MTQAAPARTEIRLAGSGGQGLILGARILFTALGIEGRRAAQSQSYEPTSRGGFCYSDVIVGEDWAGYPLATGLDIVAALSQPGLDRSLAQIRPGALVIADSRLVPDLPKAGFELHVLPLADRAVAVGSPRIANIVALGALVALSRVVTPESLEAAIREETPKRFAELNLEAARAGLELGELQPA